MGGLMMMMMPHSLCPFVHRGQCTNSELPRDENGTIPEGTPAIANLRLSVNGKDVTEDLLKLPITTAGWFPLYYIEGGLEDAALDWDALCSGHLRNQCINNGTIGLDGKLYRIWRDNAYTAGYYTLLDTRECDQSAGSKFTFSFSGDVVDATNPTGKPFFGFEEVTYDIHFSDPEP
ncbi:hypothetical protein CYMTET_15453 [Cymbomonas tetramitiformis]|uniref:Uncharacterized protein n=1 Tax=Cymbomonas tetramitiformis TaxID=36881 RepID=A0AAE0GEC3_9CHLO|nr:hypothetical protein CYMTET_15451 [Cymbomonas tetramitiformis]KAK3276474.1 hypothetical protein CYMTET_15453 [Cymbomonas tetramitiformis]